jgi:predicted  nucleic acid-binding Zn-ribbon protein
MAKEAGIADNLRMLWNLQQVDSQLDEIQILKGELPMEVADLEDEVAGLETRINNLKAKLKESELEVVQLSSEAKDNENNIKRYQKQLDEVKNNREFEALNKEIELAKIEVQLLEKKSLKAKNEVEVRKESLVVTEARAAAKVAELDAKKVELKGIIEKTEQEENKLRKNSEQARDGIEDRLLNAYNKIRRTYRNGLAVVTVERNSCGGCFNNVPPQVQLEIGLYKKIIACEHCGRILVDQSIAHPQIEVA